MIQLRRKMRCISLTLLFKRRPEWPPAVKSISVDERLNQNETVGKEERQNEGLTENMVKMEPVRGVSIQTKKINGWEGKDVLSDPWTYAAHVWVGISSVVKSLNVDLHCRVRRVPAAPRSVGTAVLFRTNATKLFRLKEELSKQLLTPVSSTDHHLVRVLVVLPSYRTVLHPYLIERSKCCSLPSVASPSLDWN